MLRKMPSFLISVFDVKLIKQQIYESADEIYLLPSLFSTSLIAAAKREKAYNIGRERKRWEFAFFVTTFWSLFIFTQLKIGGPAGPEDGKAKLLSGCHLLQFPST
ncbi:hypothetical protein L1049_019546 [Liquidambar formosana]|uniref:Uncharacterized protein n=1 Tax=Liquidambar formosana TaxID=63359 RepID=A0AAP0S6S9_LIQFO